jgi:hypothetical protein
MASDQRVGVFKRLLLRGSDGDKTRGGRARSKKQTKGARSRFNLFICTLEVSVVHHIKHKLSNEGDLNEAVGAFMQRRWEPLRPTGGRPKADL